MKKCPLGKLWSPMKTMGGPHDLLEGRKQQKRVGELRNVAKCKQGLTAWRGERGRNGLVSSETWHITKRGLTCWRGGRGRNGLVSSEMWHIAKRGLTCWREEKGRSRLVSSETRHVGNEDTLSEREEEGEMD